METIGQVSVSAGGFLRLSQIIGDRRANPPVPGLIPIGRSTWWQWVRDGKAPAPVKLASRITAWRTEDVLALVSLLKGESVTKAG